MRWATIVKILGVLVLLLGICMMPCLFMAAFDEKDVFQCFLISTSITVISGILIIWVSKWLKPGNDFITQKEGMTIVALSWSCIGLFGALPFFFSPVFDTFTNAFFESVSGFTTTGSSILTDIEACSDSLLLWRSLIQWIGGMGIIVLSIAILPFLGLGGYQLYKAEVPSPVPDKLTPRLSDSAKILWMVYAGLTVLEVIALKIAGMPFFDAVCHSLTTLPTGGFSPKNTSVAHYNSAAIEYIIVFFMVMAGINFSLHFQALRGRPIAFWKDTECRFYLFMVLLVTLIISFNTLGKVYDSFFEAFRFSFFQVASIFTTTGFASADYELYPGLSQIWIFILMFIGGCAGSTGGGIKCARILVAGKYCYREIFKNIHPNSVRPIKFNKTIVPEEISRTILGFIILYIVLFFGASLLLAAMGTDMTSSFGAVAACLGNIGPGFGSVGPTENFAHMPMAGKWLLSLCMLMGRLEIYTMIILFIPEFWKK